MNTHFTTDQLTRALHSTFKFNEFREGQLEAIMTLLNHGRVLVVQPTGHGKSLLYQLPATLLEGMTLVISPLLALMRDQIMQLEQRFGIPAASINSDQSADENLATKKAVLAGKTKILFIAPEQLNDIAQLEFFLALPISLVVVDEAHCISTWGHDFRPSYRQILATIETLQQKHHDLKVLGLTATANDKTETDIKQQLSTPEREVKVIRANMDRPNIQLAVINTRGPATKLMLLEQLLQQLKGCGLIYCATRDNTEMVAEHLQQKNYNIKAYHAGLSPEEKRELQQNFIHGTNQLIAATNALGMGIDKADLRFIIHFDIPGSISAYYQEVGRCGRDGKPAQGILLYDPVDKKIQQHFIDSAQPSLDDFQNILNCIASSSEPATLTAIKRMTGMHPTRVTVVIAELTEQGYLVKTRALKSQIYQRTDKSKQPDLSRYIAQLEVRTRELNDMLNYGRQKTTCLMASLRFALGDKSAKSCGHCSLCSAMPFHLNNEENRVKQINIWLAQRTTTIKPNRIHNTLPGIAILDGKLRSNLFIDFMKQRSHSSPDNLGLAEDLLALIKSQLQQLKQRYQFSAVIPIPSRTWGARDVIARLIAKQLNATLILNILSWRELPLHRQGELHNNDQRRFNVDKKMQADLSQIIPKGTILLLDDYIGSGVTLKEASRSLRKDINFSEQIVPFTIASVQWRLGKAGMI